SVKQTFKSDEVELNILLDIGVAHERDKMKSNVGIYDSRNQLNDLTGKEWLKLTTSVWFSRPEPLDEFKVQHPATFAESDIEKLITLFTKKGMTVLDPFAGVGSTLIACHNTQRKGIGVELNPKYVELTKKRFEKYGINTQSILNAKSANGISKINQRIICGDSLDLLNLIQEPIHYCVTSPPYHNILKNKGNGIRHDGSQKRQGVVYYSDHPNDLGNQKTFDKFLDLLQQVFYKVYKLLINGRYISVIISDFTVNKQEVDVHGCIIRKLQEIGYIFKGTTILVQENKPIYPYGYPYQYVINHHHQYIINFQK
ncbi:MAG: DNA methyltransferase, partial [Methanosarcinales archaeon]